MRIARRIILFTSTAGTYDRPLGLCFATYRSLRVLREVNVLNILWHAKRDGPQRPTKQEEVTTLDLTGSPVTDEGLRGTYTTQTPEQAHSLEHEGNGGRDL